MPHTSIRWNCVREALRGYFVSILVHKRAAAMRWKSSATPAGFEMAQPLFMNKRDAKAPMGKAHPPCIVDSFCLCEWQ